MNVFKTDWIASNPVFYNEKTGKISNNINDVIDYSDVEFHSEGFNNYLDYGYSVFEQTPIKDVKFLPHSSSITLNNEKQLVITHDNDITEKWIGKESQEDEVFDKLFLEVHNWEESVKGEIIIPTSGGFDSRLLNIAIKDKSRIRSFSYGLSDDQGTSYEVVYAKKLAALLGIKWEQIFLGNYNEHFEDWDNLYGISTHAHGLYHFEFYKKIADRVGSNHGLISGIFGDIWAGNVNFTKIDRPEDLIKLSYNHGLCGNSDMSLLESKCELRNRFYEKNIEKLKNEFYQIITLIRLKIILISYLIKVPLNLGFNVWSPFLIPDISLGMLTLPPLRRKNRQWQRDFFLKNKLNIEAMKLKINKKNTLHLQANLTNPLKLLDPELLKEVVRPQYVKWINREINTNLIAKKRLIYNVSNLPRIGTILRKIEISNIYKAYFAYLTLKPIEYVIRKRNKLCR